MIKLKEIYGNPLRPQSPIDFLQQQVMNSKLYTDVDYVKKQLRGYYWR